MSDMPFWSEQLKTPARERDFDPAQHAQAMLNNTAVLIDANGESVATAAGRKDLAEPYIAKAKGVMSTRLFTIGDILYSDDVDNGMPTDTLLKVIAIEAKAIHNDPHYTLEDEQGQIWYCGEPGLWMPAEDLPLRECGECLDLAHMPDDYLCWKCRNTSE